MCGIVIEVDRMIPIDFNEVWVTYILNLYKNKCRFPHVVYLYLKERVPTSLQKHYQN